MVTGADRAGVTVSSSTRWASALSTCTLATSTGSVDRGRRVAAGGEGGGDRAGRQPSRSRVRPSAGSTTVGVVPSMVIVASTGARSTCAAIVLELGGQRGLVAGDDRGDLAVAEQASSAGSTGSAAGRRRRRRCRRRRARGPPSAGGGWPSRRRRPRCGRPARGGPASSRAPWRRRRGRGRRCRRRPRRSSAGCHRRRARRSAP